jgi:hypothetical protein
MLCYLAHEEEDEGAKSCSDKIGRQISQCTALKKNIASNAIVNILRLTWLNSRWAFFMATRLDK